MRIERGTKKWLRSTARDQKSVWLLKHEVHTVNRHKIALNRDDDKRLVQANGITTLARGYVALLA